MECVHWSPTRVLALWMLLIGSFNIAGLTHGPVPAAMAESLDAARVSAVSGGEATLPCDTRSPQLPDALLLVVWYKDDVPIYSYDGRVKDAKAHWADDTLKGRALWHSKAPSSLRIRDVVATDRALYRCRVDFKVSPTRNQKIVLDVVELPEKPKIFDELDKEVIGVAGPYREDASLKLTCVVSGGKPMPRLRWWRDDKVIATLAPLDDGSRLSLLELKIPKLTRDYLEAVYTCTADNTPLVPPLRANVQIQLYLRPLLVEILAREQPLSVGQEAEVSCRAVGARPPALVTWWLDGKQLTGAETLTQNSDAADPANETISVLRWTPRMEHDRRALTCRAAHASLEHSAIETTMSLNLHFSNETVSVLRWTPRMEHDRRALTCRAAHASLEHSAIETTMSLNLHYMPIVSLELGSKLNPNDIEEGDDVYFDCVVKANPPAYKVVWEHNGQLMTHNQRAGVIAGSAHLALQGVSREQAGKYVCTASNVEGDGKSSPVSLQVIYKPICATKTHSPLIVGAALNEAVRVTCEVDGFPIPKNFQWTLNNSMGTQELDAAKFTIETHSGRSILNFTPSTEADYGSLACRATNLAGQQIEPCRYTVLPAVKPDPPLNCTALNLTDDAVELRCSAGYDGGLRTTYYVEAWAAGSLVANSTAASPLWRLRALGAGRALKMVFYAHNARGRSEAVTLRIHTLSRLALHTEAKSSSGWDMSWALGSAAGLAGALVLVLCLALLLKKRTHRPMQYEAPLQSSKGYKGTIQSNNHSPIQPDDKNPDVVPLGKDFNCAREADRPPEPPPYGAVVSPPAASRSSGSLHDARAHTPHTPNTPASDAQSIGTLAEDRRSVTSGTLSRRREVVTTRTPLLANARESCV